MDFRTSRPTDRTATSRPRPAQRQTDEPEPAKEAPKQVYRAVPSDHVPRQKRSKRFIWPIIVVLVVAILGVAGWFVWQGTRNAGTAIDSSKYQAIFFTNGQIYFGKLQAFNDDYLKLTDIYYLQAKSNGETDTGNPQKTTTEQNNVQLIKLGDEVHGPQDEMIISRDQVLFYENLKPDGKVSQSIEKFKSSN